MIVANLAVNDSFFAGTRPNIESLEHECLLDRQETVLYACTLSNVLLNLTCSGLAAASVLRSCPVPQRVCSVLSLTSVSIAISNYCQVIATRDIVQCKCGFQTNQTATEKAAVTNAIAASGGAINVAVMTEFVSGGFDGSVYISTVLNPANQLVEQSTAVVSIFGGCLLIWLCLLLFLSWDNVASLSMKETVLPVASNDRLASGRVDVIPDRSLSEYCRDYLLSVLPAELHVFQHWSRRLYYVLIQNHTYLRVGMVLRRSFIQWRYADTVPSKEEQLALLDAKKKARMSIVQILTEFTTSCWLLAVVFDLQYPSDDGSCGHHTTLAACLLRKSLLDPTESYCQWHPRAAPIAGILTEVLGSSGQVVHRTELESSVLSQAAGMEHQCQYNAAPRSVTATVIAMSLASMLALPMSLLLSFVLQLIRSHPLQELLHRQLLLTSLSSHDKLSIGPFDPNVVPVQQSAESSDSQPTIWQRLYAYWIQMYKESVVQIPDVPILVKQARRKCIRHMQPTRQQLVTSSSAISATSPVSGKRKQAIMRLPVNIHETASSRKSNESEQSPSNRLYPARVSQRLQDREVLIQYANEAEFGMIQLQELLVEALPTPFQYRQQAQRASKHPLPSRAIAEYC